jgi:hypothetical protein
MTVWSNDRPGSAETISAGYCRGCDPTHEADGLCSYHAHQFRKLNLYMRKRVGRKPLVVRKLGPFDYQYPLP